MKRTSHAHNQGYHQSSKERRTRSELFQAPVSSQLLKAEKLPLLAWEEAAESCGPPSVQAPTLTVSMDVYTRTIIGFSVTV
jgi:hypothetical protein